MPQEQSPQTPPTQPTKNDLSAQMNSGFFTNKKKLIFLLFGLIFFLLATSALTLRKSQTQIPQPPRSQLSATPTSKPNSTTNWIVYKDNTLGIEFKHPSNWYWETVPGFKQNNISFFKTGTQADHSFGDHAGNELLNLSIQEDNRTLVELKTNTYPKSSFTAINNNQAIMTTYNSFLVKPDKNKLLFITVRKLTPETTHRVLSSIEFLNKSESDNPPGVLRSECIDYRETYTDTNLGIKFEHGCTEPVSQEASLEIYRTRPIGSLRVSRDKSFDPYQLPLCEPFSQITCLNPGENWGRSDDIETLMLDGVPAISFFIVTGSNTTNDVIHVVQTTESPIIEIATSVAGVSGEKEFQRVVNTFEFLE